MLFNLRTCVVRITFEYILNIFIRRKINRLCVEIVELNDVVWENVYYISSLCYKSYNLLNEIGEGLRVGISFKLCKLCLISLYVKWLVR